MITKEDIKRLLSAWESTWDGKKGHHVNAQALSAIRQALREEFARLYGWRVSKRWFALSQLKRGSSARRRDETYQSLVSALPGSGRHVEYYRDGRRPAAILVHCYKPSGRLHSTFAKQHGLKAERLAFSWYSPDRCIAVLYTPDHDAC